MSDEELKKYLKDNFTNYIRESIDSSIIFKYINEIETENKKLNNIIVELENWFKGYHKSQSHLSWYEEDYIEFIEHLENELKGGDKDENNRYIR